jgi:hypothetical protein
MSKLLITFGCSWTKGIGAGYGEEYQSKDKNDFKTKCWESSLNEKYAYRSLLCKKYNLQNINFSIGGSSNQTQFRLAEEFFVSEKFNIFQQESKGNIYVLWAITSTARGEIYVNALKKFKSIFYNTTSKNDLEHKLAELIAVNFYNHEAELVTLNNRMKHWNQYFTALSIKNIWIDTFNHHKYLNPVDNLCFKNDIPRDLLSKIMNIKLYNEIYHISNWNDDCILIKPAIAQGLLNPYSMHPTSKAHKIIAEILSPEIEKLIDT